MKSLFPGAALAILASTAAMADTIALTATEDGTVVGTASSASGTLDVNNQAFGTFNVNTLTINSQATLAPPAILDTNTLDLQDTVQAAAHTLVIDIVASGLTGPSALRALLSEFSVTGLTTGWSAVEATSINGTPLSTTPLLTGNSSSFDLLGAAVLTNPYSAEVKYTINATPGTGEFNGGIDINTAAVPGPTAGAGAPGLALGLALAWFGWRRRHRA
jgi:hypothetical protein